jgi:hypothetical protein
MNGAHLHLIICHIPIIGAGFTTLLILFSLLKKSKDIKQASLWFAVITGISALVVYLTGSGAEGYVKTVPGITEEIIEPHEQMALYYLITLLFISVIALAGLFLSQASVKVLHKFVLIVLLLNILASYLAVTTGLSGGKIRHTEINVTTPVADDDDD